jgi:hypothetical protein
LSEYQSLLKSQGWARLVELANEQVLVRQQLVMAMEEKELGDFIEGVRLKAEARAIKLFVALPETIVEQMREDLGYEMETDE